MKCKICGSQDESVTVEDGLCDSCWYGMRMNPEEWEKDLSEKGIKVVKDSGCQIFPGGCICGPLYKVSG